MNIKYNYSEKISMKRNFFVKTMGIPFILLVCYIYILSFCYQHWPHWHFKIFYKVIISFVSIPKLKCLFYWIRWLDYQLFRLQNLRIGKVARLDLCLITIRNLDWMAYIKILTRKSGYNTNFQKRISLEDNNWTFVTTLSFY